MKAAEPRKFDDATSCANLFAIIFIHYVHTIRANAPDLCETALHTVRRQVLLKLARQEISDRVLLALIGVLDFAADTSKVPAYRQ